MFKHLPLFLTFIIALAFSCQTTKPQREYATLILTEGVVWTADTLYPEAGAVAVKGNRILYMGNSKGALAFKNDSTEVIDLQGAFVMPGLIEGHGHFASLGESLINVQLLQTKSWEEVVQAVQERLAETENGDWIEGRGWHQEKWDSIPGRTVNGYPFHHALSEATPDHPVVLKHASGHALMANQKAMDLAGISSETPDPVGGRIVRDAAGQLTGVFEENAMGLIGTPLAEWKDLRSEEKKQADFDKTISLASELCLKNGITSFQDAGSSFWQIEQYERLAETSRLDLRLWLMIRRPGNTELDQLRNFPKRNLGNRFLTVGGVKAYLDGALGSYGAWLLESYNDKPAFLGQNTTPIDTLRLVAEKCRAYQLQFCIHAIGDRANREVLDLYEEYTADVNDHRWRIEHAQHLSQDDIPRFSQLGVIASMQAIHCTSDAPFVEKRLGEERARTGAYPWRSLIDSGAHLANGTDAPVEAVDPLACLYASCTRKRPDSGLEFYPEQAMTREEALLSYTIWNAYAVFEEEDKGSLEPGKLADIVVFDTNLLECQPEEILEAKLMYTIVDGKIKYRM